MAFSVAILGAGYIADWHCRALRDVQPVAVCDRDAGRARLLADRYRIPRTFTDLATMLAEAKPDVVHVLLPPDHHFEAAEQALRANVHVLLEKPMAVTAEECRSLGELAMQHGRAVGVNHNFLFDPVYERLRADVRAGKLGRLDQVTINWNRELGQIRGGPFGGWLFREPGNVMLEVGPHSAAHLLDLVGQPDRLTAEADRPIELPTGTEFCRRWQAHAKVGETVVDLNWSFEAGHPEHNIHVRGTAGSATADMERGTYVLRRGGASGQDDIDRYGATTKEGRSIRRQARCNFGRYVLSKFRLSRRGSLFGTSIARALESFYRGLPAPADERLSSSFAGDVVDLCKRIGADAKNLTLPTPLPVSGRGEEDLGSSPPSPVGKGVGGLGSSPAPSLPARLPQSRERGECSLVLGGTGFIGKALVRRLVDSGRSVRLLVRDPAGLPKSLRELPLDVVRGDLNDAESVDQAFAGVRDVFHLARGGGKIYDDYVRSDLKPTEAVAAACLKHGIRRLVYTGTIDSLDTSTARTIDGDTPVDPNIQRRNQYARIKAEAERRLLELHAARKLPVVIIRPGVVVGAGASPFHWGVAWWPGPFVCRFLGRGDNPLPLVLVDDVARALVRATEVDGIEGESLNLVAETDITARDYVEALARATETWIDVRPRSALRYYLNDLAKYVVKVLVRHPGRRLPSYRDWAARGQYARFDCSKAKRLLGWQPVTDRTTLLREGVEVPAREWSK
jgi:predicted dehydrogenase/nucleoside-diphosphate-sugar epimerase